jgi:hypothetical protein
MKRFLIAVMVIACVSAMTLQAQNFGDWTVSAAPKEAFVFAVTANDSGRIFGQFCFYEEGNCMWLLTTASSCDEGHQYPILANSDQGSRQLSLACIGMVPGKSDYRLAFSDFDEIDSLVQKSSRIALAIPLHDDSFTVVRFNLKGGKEAITKMRALADKASDAPMKNTGTRDTKL